MKKMQIFIFIVALICFLGSGGYLAKYYWERHISAKNMDEVKSLLVEETKTTETDGNPNSEKAVNAYNTAKTEMQNFKKDNYEYEPNGRGWYLKDNMDESIRRAIRKVLH